MTRAEAAHGPRKEIHKMYRDKGKANTGGIAGHLLSVGEYKPPERIDERVAHKQLEWRDALAPMRDYKLAPFDPVVSIALPAHHHNFVGAELQAPVVQSKVLVHDPGPQAQAACQFGRDPVVRHTAVRVDFGLLPGRFPGHVAVGAGPDGRGDRRRCRWYSHRSCGGLRPGWAHVRLRRRVILRRRPGGGFLV